MTGFYAQAFVRYDDVTYKKKRDLEDDFGIYLLCMYHKYQILFC